jgi:hypothetical protein
MTCSPPLGLSCSSRTNSPSDAAHASASAAQPPSTRSEPVRFRSLRGTVGAAEDRRQPRPATTRVPRISAISAGWSAGASAGRGWISEVYCHVPLPDSKMALRGTLFGEPGAWIDLGIFMQRAQTPAAAASDLSVGRIALVLLNMSVRPFSRTCARPLFEFGRKREATRRHSNFGRSNFGRASAGGPKIEMPRRAAQASRGLHRRPPALAQSPSAAGLDRAGARWPGGAIQRSRGHESHS